MKTKKGLVTQWLQFVGKDKLQTFQDNFAKTYGTGISFFDLTGKPLTVRSKDPLFCFTIGKEHAAQCHENFRADTETILQGKPFIHVCPFGVTCIYVPVFFDNYLIAFAAVGGLADTDSPIPEKLRAHFHISSYNKEKMEEIMMLLDSLLRLLNIHALHKEEILPQKETVLPAQMQDDCITLREYDVIKLLCKGYSNKEIAGKLHISPPTVKTHIRNILTKLQLHGRMQIVARYIGEIELMGQPDSDE
mgnify:CR=1 FL=1